MLTRIADALRPSECASPPSEPLTAAIAAQSARSIERFRALMPVEWAPRTVLPSEAFAVCALCDLYGIDTVIESGVYEGRSTLFWGSWGNGRLSVVAIDEALRDGARKRLSTFSNVSLIEGNAHEEVAKQIRRARKRRVAVFIDGPKNRPAIELAQGCIRHRNVLFVGVHDVNRLKEDVPKEARLLMDAAGAGFYTDEEWFTRLYSELDSCESQHVDEGQDGMRWQPGRYTFRDRPDRILGSYGPTVGFLVKDPNVEGGVGGQGDQETRGDSSG